MSKKLKQHIESLSGIITLTESRDPNDLPDLKVVFDRFMKYIPVTNIQSKPRLTSFHIRDISDVSKGVDLLESGSSVGQAFRADEIAGELEGYIQSITWHVSDLQVSVLRPAWHTKVGYELFGTDFHRPLHILLRLGKLVRTWMQDGVLTTAYRTSRL